MIGYVSKDGATLILSKDGFQYCVDLGNTILKLPGESVDVKAYVQKEIPDVEAVEIANRIDKLEKDAYAKSRITSACEIYHRTRNAIKG